MHRHVADFFAGHEVGDERWADTPSMRQRLPAFRVIRVAPGPRSPLWIYVSAGCWDATRDGEHGLEFLLAAPADDERHVLHLAMAAHYHCNPDDESYRLDHGHTVPIGEPWLPGSACDHLLVSLPYPFGPELEMCRWDGGHARLLWLLPITEAERDFRTEHDLEALEQRFDDVAIRYWEADRPSVV